MSITLSQTVLQVTIQDIYKNRGGGLSGELSRLWKSIFQGKGSSHVTYHGTRCISAVKVTHAKLKQEKPSKFVSGRNAVDGVFHYIIKIFMINYYGRVAIRVIWKCMHQNSNHGWGVSRVLGDIGCIQNREGGGFFLTVCKEPASFDSSEGLRGGAGLNQSRPSWCPLMTTLS